MKIIKSGFYIISDNYFKEYNDPNLKGNKSESRPHYYCLEDSINGIYWMIPLSTKVNKYKNIINKIELNRKKCNTLYIAKLANGKENVFLLQDMFPVTSKYILREYTINGKHYILNNIHINKELNDKAKITLGMIKRGIKFMKTSPNVMKIYNILKNNIK